VDLHVLALVLLAAAAHAAWNAWLKDSGDKLSSMAAISVGWLIVGCISIPIVGAPSLASWPYLLASTVVHTGYAMLLISAYRHAEFSLAYPIARGTGPMLVALSAPLFVSEYLEGPSFFAVTLIVIGIFLIGMFGNERSLGGRRAVLLSLATGVLIAAYTMIDGQGARVGSDPHAYVGWLLVLIAFPIIVLSKKKLNKNVKSLLDGHWQKGIPIGVLSALAYWVIVWAMTVAPMALVAATRETSILFAALVSWGVLGEKVRPLRWAGVIVTLIGLILAKF
jgi:drug/metabolite transporter (DMT)-like permease